MAGNVYQIQGTLAGATTISLRNTANFTAGALLLSNDDLGNTYTVTLQGRNSTLRPGEVAVYTGYFPDVVLNGVGAYRLFAVEDGSKLPSLDKAGAPVLPATGSVTASMLADGLFGVTECGSGAGGKFDPSCLTTANVSHLFDTDAFDAGNVSVAFAAGSIPDTKLAPGTAVDGIDLSHVQKANFSEAIAPIPGIYRLANGDVAGGVPIVVGQRITVCDVWFVQGGVGNALDRVQLLINGNPVTNNMNFMPTPSGTIIRPTGIDPSLGTTNAGSTLTAFFTDGSAGAGDLSGVLYVSVLAA